MIFPRAVSHCPRCFHMFPLSLRRLHYHTFQALTTHVLMNELQLTVQVKGGAWVQGPMGIRIKVGLECELHCAVEKLFDYEARHEVVKSKECQYSYF